MTKLLGNMCTFRLESVLVRNVIDHVHRPVGPGVGVGSAYGDRLIIRAGITQLSLLRSACTVACGEPVSMRLESLFMSQTLS